MKLYIVRHGETEANTRHVISGRLDTALTDRGREQAAKLGRRLAGERFDRIYTSTLSRARETTSIATAGHSVPPIHLVELCERSWGSHEGWPVEDYLQKLQEYGAEPWSYRPEGGESLQDLRVRISTFLSELRDQPFNSVLISAHHSVNKMFLHLILEREWSQWSELQQDNTCVNIVEFRGGKGHALLVNCTEHLTEYPA